MSLIKANAVQVGQSPTATQNFTLAVPSSPDGTIKLARGNAGATTQDVLSVDASGNINGLVQATGSTTARSLANRFADVVNVKDFGAVGDGVADDTTAIQAAITAATPNKTIYFPGTGKYKITSTITVPSTVKVNFASNASVVPYTSFIVNGILYRDGFSPYDRIETGDPVGSNEHGRCFEFRTNSEERSNSGEYNYSNITISKDEVSYDSGGGKVAGLIVNHNFGGPKSSGGRHAIHGRALHGYGGPATQGPPNPATIDRNYVGVVGQVLTDAWEGGTAGSPKGAFFGINAYAGAGGNSTYIFNLTSGEFNTDIATGDVNRVFYHSGIQIASNIGTRGTFVDAAISISNLGGSPNTWSNGILMGAQNGANALGTDSTAIKINSPHNTTIDVTGINVPYILKSNNVEIFNQGINGEINLGSKTAVSSPRINFYTNGTNVIDSTIATGIGVIALQAPLTTVRTILPEVDNLTFCGIASKRWSAVYSAGGVITTSDERSKQNIESISDKEKLVAQKLKTIIKKFKFNDAVEKKGDKARTHFGVIAQEVKSAFEDQNLNPDNYGLFCYDEWNEIKDSFNSDGSISIKGNKAGNIYGIRYAELLTFIISTL
jgi:hypothetical protein